MSDLTPLAFAALGLLTEGPSHPYEMFQTMMQRRDGRNVKVRPGTLYHQVGRLVELGYAQVVGTDRDGNRPERTTYAVTDSGRAALRERLLALITQPAEEYPVFHLAVSEIENLSAAEAVHALTERTRALQDQLAEADEIVQVVRAKDLPERYWLDVSYVRAMLAAQIEWLRATTARIDDGAVPWTELVRPESTTTSKEPTR